jgi:hypothetical protein
MRYEQRQGMHFNALNQVFLVKVERMGNSSNAPTVWLQ